MERAASQRSFIHLGSLPPCRFSPGRIFQTYIVFQAKSFHSLSSDASISWESGLVQGSFTAAQCITAVIWGRLADAPWCGRKIVLVIGLLSTAISCIGVAFATSVVQIMLWRAFDGGMNGTVGIM